MENMRETSLHNHCSGSKKRTLRVLLFGSTIFCHVPGVFSFSTVKKTTWSSNSRHFVLERTNRSNALESKNNPEMQSWSSLNVLFRKSSNKKIGSDSPDANTENVCHEIKGIVSAREKKKSFNTEIRCTSVAQIADLDTRNMIREELPPTTLMDNERKSTTSGCRVVESQMEGFFRRRSQHMKNLQVHADKCSNSLLRLLRGIVGTVHVTFDRLAFKKITMSGGEFSIPDGAEFALLSLNPGPTNWVKRYPKDFRIQATNVIFNQDDVMNSFYIKRGIELMLRRILKNLLVRTMGSTVQIQSVEVTKVEILESGKLSCRGSVTPLYAVSFPFQVVTMLEPSDCGHILHFPGIEVAMHYQHDGFDSLLNLPPLINIPLHTFFPVDLDVGENANIQKIFIDGKRKRVEISMWSNVTPLKLDVDRIDQHYKRNGQESNSDEEYVKSARFYCDVGRWITKIGRFAE